MNFKNIKEETLETIKAFTISGVLIVIFYLLIQNIGNLLGFLGTVIKVLSPFIYGILFTLVLSPFRRLIEEKWLAKSKLKPRIKRKIATGICILTLLLAILLFIGILAPQLIESITVFVGSMDSYINTVRSFFEGLGEDHASTTTMIVNVLNALGTKASEWLTGAQGGLSRLLSASITFAKGVANFFIGVIISVYLLIDEEKFRRQFKAFLYAILPNDRAKKIFHYTKLTSQTFYSFLIGKFIDSFIIGIITYLVVVIMRMPYAPMIAAVVGITNMIPVFGPFIGAIPCTLILLIISPFKALEFLIFIIILQQIDGNIIGPYILGEAVGLPTLWVMFAILVGGALFGVVGMFIGVPLFSVVYVTVQKIIEEHLEAKNINIDNTQELKNIK